MVRNVVGNTGNDDSSDQNLKDNITVIPSLIITEFIQVIHLSGKKINPRIECWKWFRV